MNRYTTALTATAAALALGACVSTGKYEKLEADKNKEIANLQQQTSTLESERTALSDQIAGLSKEKTSLQEQIAALEKEKTALQSSSQQNQEQYDALVKKLSAEVERGQLQVRQYKNMLSVDVAEKIFFDSGRAVLKDSGKEVLGKVAEALKSYEDKVIRVVGYTDNVPIAKAMQRTFPSNWELSVARATNVVRFLQDAGVPPERMVAAGRGEYSPVAENDTPEGRQKNRRIEIMLIDRNLADELTTARQ